MNSSEICLFLLFLLRLYDVFFSLDYMPQGRKQAKEDFFINCVMNFTLFPWSYCCFSEEIKKEKNIFRDYHLADSLSVKRSYLLWFLMLGIHC